VCSTGPVPQSFQQWRACAAHARSRPRAHAISVTRLSGRIERSVIGDGARQCRAVMPALPQIPTKGEDTPALGRARMARQHGVATECRRRRLRFSAIRLERGRGEPPDRPREGETARLSKSHARPARPLPSVTREPNKGMLTDYIVPVVPRSGIRHARLDTGSGWVPDAEAAGASGSLQPPATMQAAEVPRRPCPGMSFACPTTGHNAPPLQAARSRGGRSNV
jgi:hypothetical protein